MKELTPFELFLEIRRCRRRMFRLLKRSTRRTFLRLFWLLPPMKLPVDEIEQLNDRALDLRNSFPVEERGMTWIWGRLAQRHIVAMMPDEGRWNAVYLPEEHPHHPSNRGY